MGLSKDSTTNFKTCKFGLALSGGGYRAALFHLGALRRLNEIGWLKRLDRITSVSGGSLLLGFLLSKCPDVFDRTSSDVTADDWTSVVSGPVHKFVKNDLRTIQTLQNFSVYWFSRREQRLDSTISRLEKLYGEKRLADFLYTPNGKWPELYILATDIVNGQAFRFSNNIKQSAHRQLKLCDLSFFPLHAACAISACFPPIFGPVSMRRELQRFAPDDFPSELKECLSDVMLIDGGLYDNLGLNLIVNTRKKFVRLFSDAGNPYKPSTEWTGSGLVIGRYLQLMSDFIGRLNVQRVKMIKKNDYAFWSAQFPGKGATKKGFGFSKELVENHLRYVRTDLDRFTEAEAKILENHGYAQAELALRSEFGSIYNTLAVPEAMWPYPAAQFTDEAKIRPVLEKAVKRKRLASLFELDLVL